MYEWTTDSVFRCTVGTENVVRFKRRLVIMTVTVTVDEKDAPVDQQDAEPGWKRLARDALLVMAGLVFIVSLMFSCYSSGFGDPKPHDIPIAVVGTQSEQSTLNASPGLQVRPAVSAAAARELVLDREVYGAFDLSERGHLTLFVADGAGHSVDVALTSIGTEVAQSQHATISVEDLAPISPNDPNGTLEFYGIVFLAIGASLGATVLSKVLGAVRHLQHLGRRLLTLLVYSFFLSVTVSFFADVVFGALVGHFGLLLLSLWAYTLAICLAASGVSALFGQVAGVVLVLAFTVIGNPSAGGAVGRPLTNRFFAAMNPIFPHGAGMNIVRGVQYFDGRGFAESVLCLSLWAATGLTFLVVFAFRQGRGPIGRHEKRTRDETVRRTRRRSGKESMRFGH